MGDRQNRGLIGGKYARKRRQAAVGTPTAAPHGHRKRAKLDAVAQESPRALDAGGGRYLRISTAMGLDPPQAQPNGEYQVKQLFTKRDLPSRSGYKTENP